MQFLDQVKIHIESGDGGTGCCSLYRARGLPRGGPDGGNGGTGGGVYVQARAGLNTLVDYRYHRHFRASRGRHGSSRLRAGARGTDCVLTVPLGTQIFDEQHCFMLADLVCDRQRLLLLPGGAGGWGNSHYKSSTNRTPRQADRGQPGQGCWLWLQLKLLADVGIVGLPNAGKSTLLAACSAARPKIADYPFTTLTPQLGVVHTDNGEFVMVDLPGLIAGASSGCGLGLRFLSHLERCRVLLHLIDANADIEQDYHTVRRELESYSQNLATKPEVLALNKIDTVNLSQLERVRSRLELAAKKPVHLLSGISGEGRSKVIRSVEMAIGQASQPETVYG